jgi:transcriptional regulator with GAF, ATPase, and Fis domain
VALKVFSADLSAPNVGAICKLIGADQISYGVALMGRARLLRLTPLAIAGATLLLGSYVIGVLWHAQGVPEIGFQFVFRPVIDRCDTAFIDPSFARTSELIGGTIEQVGDRSVATWPQLLRALEALDRASYPDRSSLQDSEDVYARVDGEEWVKVRVRPAATSSTSLALWCRVGHAPPVAILPLLLWFCVEMAVFLVAAFVWWNRPEDPSSRLFFLMTLTVVTAFTGGYHWARIVTQPPLLVVYMVSAVLLPAVSLHFYQVFPRPKPWLEARPIRTLSLTYGPSLVFLGIMLGGYLWVRALNMGGAPASEVETALLMLARVIYGYFGVAAVLYLTSVLCLAHSYRRAHNEVERNQVRWIFVGSILAIIPLGYSLYSAVWLRQDLTGGPALWPMFAASVCFTCAFTVSITRYRLLQLDQLLTSGVAYFLVSALAALVYYSLVFAGTLIMGTHGESGPSIEQAFWVSGSALVLTAGLDLARSRLRRALDRRYRRDKTQLDRTLDRMGEAIGQLVDPPALAQRLLHAAADLFGVASGTVYLRQGEPPQLRVAGYLGPAPSIQNLPADAPMVQALNRFEVLPPREAGVFVPAVALGQLKDLGGMVAVGLEHEESLRAVLVLGPKLDGSEFSTDDLNLLAAFAPFTALALASAEGHRTIESLNRDLQTKVDKISEQQRRILALQQQLTTQARFRAPKETEVAETLDPPIEGIVGTSPALRRVMAVARKVAASHSAVLIRGESGSGKGVLAKAIHETSARAGRPFVKVHCAALAPSLLESELFGHVKGAFTGAVRDKPGRFEMAAGGTLFLDEIGDISLDLQTKLLRVLQEKTFERVGSNEPIHVDVRLVAATHQNLELLIRQNQFREDLYYRLNVITLSMPSLRERSEDIPDLAQHFLQEFAQRGGKTITQFEDDAMLALRAYRWPGNIRELENAIERAVVVSDGSIVTLDDLPEEVRRASMVNFADDEAMLSLDGTTPTNRWGVRSERERRDRDERSALENALTATGGNRAEAARLLGMARSTLVSRLKKHGMLRGRS